MGLDRVLIQNQTFIFLPPLIDLDSPIPPPPEKFVSQSSISNGLRPQICYAYN